jgi:hypothetical protein
VLIYFSQNGAQEESALDFYSILKTRNGKKITRIKKSETGKSLRGTGSLMSENLQARLLKVGAVKLPGPTAMELSILNNSSLDSLCLFLLALPTHENAINRRRKLISHDSKRADWHMFA